jgi:hypothetical protein
MFIGNGKCGPVRQQVPIRWGAQQVVVWKVQFHG